MVVQFVHFWLKSFTLYIIFTAIMEVINSLTPGKRRQPFYDSDEGSDNCVVNDSKSGEILCECAQIDPSTNYTNLPVSLAAVWNVVASCHMQYKGAVEARIARSLLLCDI